MVEIERRVTVPIRSNRLHSGTILVHGYNKRSCTDWSIMQDALSKVDRVESSVKPSAVYRHS